MTKAKVMLTICGAAALFGMAPAAQAKQLYYYWCEGVGTRAGESLWFYTNPAIRPQRYDLDLLASEWASQTAKVSYWAVDNVFVIASPKCHAARSGDEELDAKIAQQDQSRAGNKTSLVSLQ